MWRGEAPVSNEARLTVTWDGKFGSGMARVSAKLIGNSLLRLRTIRNNKLTLTDEKANKCHLLFTSVRSCSFAYRFGHVGSSNRPSRSTASARTVTNAQSSSKTEQPEGLMLYRSGRYHHYAGTL